MSTEQNEKQPWRKYIDEHSRRSVPVIRDKGYSVWSLIGSLRAYRGDKERVLSGYHGDLTADELDAALAYYWSKPHGIDEKLREISGDDDDDRQYVQVVSNNAPLQETGEKPWGKYIDEHSPRSVPVIRGKGFSVWSVVGYFRACLGDVEQVLADYGGYLTNEELEAALSYYWAKPYGIDERLRENSGDDEGPCIDTVYHGMSMERNEEQPWLKYIDEESRSVATIRNKGYSVWSLVRYYRVYKGDKDRALAGYHGDLASEELDAALAYYWANPEDIDRKLKEIST